MSEKSQVPLVFVAFALLFSLISIGGVSCRGSEVDEPDLESTKQLSTPTEEVVDFMSEEQAIKIASAKAEELEYSLSDQKVGVREIDGQWRVSFFPRGSEGRIGGGGLVVVIDMQTGEILSAKFQQ